MKYEICLLLGLLTFNISCNYEKVEKIKAKISILGIEKDKDTCNPFAMKKLIVELTNNTDEFLFLADVPSEISAYDYIPIHENLGSPEKDLNSKLEEIQDFYTNIENKKGNIRDTILITIPVIENQYQKNHKGNKVDIFDTWDELNSIYQAKNLICSENPYKVPEPPSELIQKKDSLINYLDSVLNKKGTLDDVERIFLVEGFIRKTLFFKPKEIKVIEYDISEFFLQKSTYIFQFVIKNSNKKENNVLENISAIYKFEKINENIISNRLTVISK